MKLFFIGPKTSYVKLRICDKTARRVTVADAALFA